MGEKLVVTDGTDSFYDSRTIVQTLFEFGDLSGITAYGSSIANSKKMLLSRQARYSGLLDMLEFKEGDFSEALAGATVWVGVNTDEAELASKLDACKAAGVSRVVIHVSASEKAPALTDVDALTQMLEASGLTFTLLRTGALAAADSGKGMKIQPADETSADQMNKEDVYRFITEAISLESAHGRIFSLVASFDASQFKEMRMAGCDRGEEADALLKGLIVEKIPEEIKPPTEEEIEAAKLSEAEEQAQEEEELKALLEKARVEGIEIQRKLAEEERVKTAKRQELAEYYRTRPSNGPGRNTPAPAAPPAPKPQEPPSPPPSPPASGPSDPPPPPGGKKPEGDDDKPDEPPLAFA